MTTVRSEPPQRLSDRRRLRKRWLLYGAAALLLALVSAPVLVNWSFDEPLPADLASAGDLHVTLAG